MEVDIDLGSRIKAARKRDKRSQGWLANKLDVCRSSVARWESGETTPTASNLKLLSRIFNENFFAEEGHVRTPMEITNEYKYELANCSSVKEIYKATQQYMANLGIDYFLYMQVFRGDLHQTPKSFIITDIDKEWQIYYAQNNLQANDPVWTHCWNSVLPIYSDDVYKKAVKNNDKAQKKVLEQFWKMGYAFYVSIPIHGPCCMAVFSVTIRSRDQVEMVRNLTPFLSYAGQLLYDNIHRVFGNAHPSNKRPRIRSADRRLMSYLVQGKPIKDIALDFNVSESAIRQRVDRLKVKFNVDNRQELCLQVVAQSVPMQSIFSYEVTSDVYEAHGLRVASKLCYK
ncbi:MAG: helix-turn-helix domain-containing protein [Gammaproteobacteria bacterium]|nr:MAG: helix-turn-helix domain-containing protein [Gammaproteobacteria bacterium]